MAQYSWSNCPDDVRTQVEHLSSRILQLLPGNVVGIYLHGSLATACFNPGRSDIDLLVITHSPTPAELKPVLARLLLDLSRHPAPIEIHFIRGSQLLPWRYPTPFDFHYSEGWRERFEAGLRSGSWHGCTDPAQADEDLGAHVMLTRRRGLCLSGVGIQDVFPEVPPGDYIDSILGDVLSDVYGLNSTFDNPVSIILNACRTLAYLRNGEVLSKDEGGDWALRNLPQEYHALVNRSLGAYRCGNGDDKFLKEQSAQLANFLREQITCMAHLHPSGEPPSSGPASRIGTPSIHEERTFHRN